MTLRGRWYIAAALLPLVAGAYYSGAAGMVRRKAGFADRDQIVQRWIHRGTETALPQGGRPLVVLITGQSNAGNYGKGPRRRFEPRVYNAFQGRLYRAQDPLLGSDGLGISPWIEFSRKLMMRGSAQSVVLALAVRGGLGVREWADRAPMRAELFLRLQDLRTLGLNPDFVLWQQGESDAAPYRTDPAFYAESVRGLVGALRRAGVSAPVLIAQATRNPFYAASPALRQAQSDLVDPANRIERGPDFDRLGPEFRYDGVHLSEAGIAAVSQMWVDAVTGFSSSRIIHRSIDIL